MARKRTIQLYRGTKNQLFDLTGDNALKQGEMAYTTDTNEVFIGTTSSGIACVGGFTAGDTASMPATNLVSGMIYHDTTLDVYYMCDGTQWNEIGGSTELQNKVNTVPTAVEDNIATFTNDGHIKDSGFKIEDTDSGVSVPEIFKS